VVRQYLDGMVHPSAAADPLRAARHRIFLIANLVCGLFAALAVPAYLVSASRPSLLVVAVLGGLFMLAPLALLVSRSGRLELGHSLGAGLLAALVALVASRTGGLQSIALVWLLVVPAEAALSGSARVIAIAVLSAMAALLGVAFLSVADLLPVAGTGVHDASLTLLVLSTGMLYAGSIALRLAALGTETEALAREFASRYQMMTRHAEEIFSLHGAGGETHAISPSAREVLQAATPSLLADGLFRRIHLGDRSRFLDLIDRARRTGEDLRADIRVLAGDDMPGLARFRTLAMRVIGSDGEAASRHDATLVVSSDVTDARDRREGASQAREDAIEANRAKTRFLANISHELRTPLNAIIGFSDLMTTRTGLPLGVEKYREYAELIHASGEHLLQIVNDILDMSRIESGNFEISREPVAAEALLASTIAMVRGQAADAGLEISLAVAPDLPDLHADPKACRQILLNLLTNAIKFSEPGGGIHVTAHRMPDSAVICVRDEGIGIGEADLVRIGQPFFQASSGYDRRRDGVGLGLSVVKGLAELHGGSVKFTSELGRGTTVSLELPNPKIVSNYVAAPPGARLSASA